MAIPVKISWKGYCNGIEAAARILEAAPAEAGDH
jgi:hypothetical protein